MTKNLFLIIFFSLCCILGNAQDGSGVNKQTNKNSSVKPAVKKQPESKRITSDDKRKEYEALKKNELKKSLSKTQNSSDLKVESTEK